MDTCLIFDCMEWRKKSRTDEHYCNVHNVDCPLHDHSGDPMVLVVNPMKVPTSWMCPQAVIEMEHHLDDAHRYRDENDTEAAGFFKEGSDELIHRAAKIASEDEIADVVSHEGVETLSLAQIDGAMYCLEEAQDELPDEIQQDVEHLHQALVQFWEDEADEDYARHADEMQP